jgi:formylglycine-generating enzyme required for sulfatase activity
VPQRPAGGGGGYFVPHLDLKDESTPLFVGGDWVREGPAAVGSYAGDRSPYGCLDMAGNAAEWCADLYDADAYLRYARGQVTPRTLHGGRWDRSYIKGYSDLARWVLVIRGGDWTETEPKRFLAAWREAQLGIDFPVMGFRYVYRVPPAEASGPEQ